MSLIQNMCLFNLLFILIFNNTINKYVQIKFDGLKEYLTIKKNHSNVNTCYDIYKYFLFPMQDQFNLWNINNTYFFIYTYTHKWNNTTNQLYATISIKLITTYWYQVVSAELNNTYIWIVYFPYWRAMSRRYQLHLLDYQLCLLDLLNLRWQNEILFKELGVK